MFKKIWAVYASTVLSKTGTVDQQCQTKHGLYRSIECRTIKSNIDKQRNWSNSNLYPCTDLLLYLQWPCTTQVDDSIF